MVVKTVPVELNAFQKMCEDIYDQHDRRYFGSFEKLMLKVVTAVGLFTKTKRHTKGEYGKYRKYFAELFVWWLAGCSYCKIKAANALWLKFPGCCPYCLAAENCSCEQDLRVVSEKSLPAMRRRKKARPKTIGAWQNMFQIIYGTFNAEKGLDYAIQRLFEEIEEIISCSIPEIRNITQLEMEFADFGARLFGIANILSIDVERELLINYPGVCPECHSEKCSCDGKW